MQRLEEQNPSIKAYVAAIKAQGREVYLSDLNYVLNFSQEQDLGLTSVKELGEAPNGNDVTFTPAKNYSWAYDTWTANIATTVLTEAQINEDAEKYKFRKNLLACVMAFLVLTPMGVMIAVNPEEITPTIDKLMHLFPLISLSLLAPWVVPVVRRRLAEAKGAVLPPKLDGGLFFKLAMLEPASDIECHQMRQAADKYASVKKYLQRLNGLGRPILHFDYYTLQNHIYDLTKNSPVEQPVLA